MSSKTIFFAGGGTGGHIYPALAVAEQIKKLDSKVEVHFFCSSRDIDSKILNKTSFRYTAIPAVGLSMHPVKLWNFIKKFRQSSKIAKEIILKAQNPVVVGVGGFVAAPVCWTAYALKLPLKLLNVDIIPGKANKLIARWADEIFAQFEDSAGHFGKNKNKVNVVGCPLRPEFENPNPNNALQKLNLDKNKKILLITGASSGSQSINDAVCELLGKMEQFSDRWQIVHLSGRGNYENLSQKYANVKIQHKVLDYWDEMADLLAAADLVIGRSGAVSVAEYASIGVPCICMPYPHHKDMHQYLNAAILVDAGAAIIVDDVKDIKDRVEWLWEELEVLMKDENALSEMKQNAKALGKNNAARKIAEIILNIPAMQK